MTSLPSQRSVSTAPQDPATIHSVVGKTVQSNGSVAQSESWFDPDQYLQMRNLAEAFFESIGRYPDLVAYEQAIWSDDAQPRQYVSTLKRESRERVLRIAEHLDHWGVTRGTAIAILSLERPEWNEAEMACYAVGARVVAAYIRDSDLRLWHILRDSGAKYAFVENQEQLGRLLQAGAPTLEGLISFESLAENSDTSSKPRMTTLPDLLATPSQREAASFAWPNTEPDEIASLYYTSGSTGLPKGVPVTHRQALANLQQIAKARLVDYSRFESAEPGSQQPIVTCILPEHAHAYPARTGQLIATSPALGRYPAVVDRRSSQITPAFRASVRRDLRERGAGVVMVVPKILIVTQQAVQEGLAERGWVGSIVGSIVNIAATKYAQDAEGVSSWWTRLLNRSLQPLRNVITRKIRSEIVGPDFEFFISGGAKLPPATAAYLSALGLTVCEGYGTTETNCPVAVNLTYDNRIGSVGKPLPGIQCRIDPNHGELLVRGPNIATGYWNLPDETAASWTPDGWYRTGDAARLDSDGYLHIFSRLDDTLVLHNGENVWAFDVESRFAVIPFVETTVVLGHQRPALVALVALNESRIRQWADDNGHSLAADWRQDPAVLTLLRREVSQHVNQNVRHSCECVRNLAVIEQPSTDQNTMTATEKVQRHEIEARYGDLIEQLYRERDTWLPGAA